VFSCLLKLPDEVRRRYDLRPWKSRSVRRHAVQVKERMTDWWGPIIHEYYGMTAMIGVTACDTAEAHKARLVAPFSAKAVRGCTCKVASAQ
jgi:long-chain acyl-CoA synthetase